MQLQIVATASRPSVHALTTPQHDVAAATCEHVLAHDFPETEEFTMRAAVDAGFDTSGALLFADPAGFHRLSRFATGAVTR